MESGTPPSISSTRITKRKLEDAIRTLDGAIVSPSLAVAIERPTPSKRPHITRSVFSTLARFSVPLKERSGPPSGSTPTLDISKSAPHLTAILQRSASRQASPPHHIPTPPVDPAFEYRPSSTDSFLTRLSTYKATTYANKPPQIDAVAAAKCGWVNDGKDRLVCGLCEVSWVLAGREGMNKDAAGALVEKQRVSLVEMHKNGCPWKARQCDASIYRVPLQAPTTMVRELRAMALSLEPILGSIAVKHPLTSSQLGSLRSIFSTMSSGASASDSILDVGETHPMVPSESAILVALFGWVPALISMCNEYRGAHTLLISRTGSYGHSASVPPTQSLSRTSFVSGRLRGSTSISTLSASPPRSPVQLDRSPDRAGVSSNTRNSVSNNSTTVPRDASFVYCILCQRRVGLWGYSRNDATSTSVQGGDSVSALRLPQKEFDIVKEHRSYCPYIVCSSVVPSFPHSSPVDSVGNVVEGWRAVLTVVQRHELSQRQRLSRLMPTNDSDSQAPSAELRGVEAMVAGVKSHGGRELLRYVKDLLG